jgi:hypothetical protein
MENSELLERFLPGYRIVCRIFARYLAIDLTDIMTVLFVLFALFKSIQYVSTSISRLLAIWLTSSISVSSTDQVYDDVLQWIAENVIDKNSVVLAGIRSLCVASARNKDTGSGMNGHASIRKFQYTVS